MFEDVTRAEKLLAVEVADLEPGRLSGEDAAALLATFTRIERLATAGRVKVARRVEQSNVWRKGGHKTAADYLARRLGESLGSAHGLLDTAEALEALPATAEAFSHGDLSMTQAKEIAGAAAVNPGAERRLLDDAARQPFHLFKTACRAARNVAADADDDQGRYRRIHESRYWRRRVDRDGAVCGEYRLAPDVGARMHGEIEAELNKIFGDARGEGRRENPEAYGADALARLVHAGATGGSDDDGRRARGPGAMVHVRVDHSVLVRGWVEDGETCDIQGVGPVPAATAALLAEDCWLKVLVTNGVDVQAVAHGGRSIPAWLRTALEERDRECTIPGCGVTRGLEIHHYPDFSDGTPASLATCARVCHWHHYLITYCGYVLAGTVGNWMWITPTRPPP